MATEIAPSTDSKPETATRTKRSATFWIAPLLAVIVVLAFFGQVFGAGLLLTPWYLPIGGTLAALLGFLAIGRPVRWWRVGILGVCVLLAGLEWAFLLGMSLLPSYAGPVKSGTPIPAFHAHLADGTAIDETYFARGKSTVLVFFQGRWCPFCMTHLRELQTHHGELAHVGAILAVVSIEDVETAAETQRDFPDLIVLSDKDRELSNAVEVINPGFGPEGEDSAAPTILIVDGRGTVKWIHRPARFIARPSAAELAKEVAARK